MLKIDHIHFYVEDAKAWQDWFGHYLGFTAATDSLPLPPPDTHTEVVKSGDVRFVLSSPLSPRSPVAEYLQQHPPGVADVAFTVADVAETTDLAQAYGAKVTQPIREYKPSFRYSQIAAWGGLNHTLIERPMSNEELPATTAGNFIDIDHIVLNVGSGDLESATAWYRNIFALQPQQKFTIQTDRSALHSQVMVSPDGKVTLPINEPASASSQIQEFLEANRGPGIQHIALLTSNLIKVIAQLRAKGLPLLSVSQNYYSQLIKKPELPVSPQELQAIAQQEILIDWKEDDPLGSILMQIFTQPIFSQPTFFWEFIERRYRASGFGEGNFRALFAAIETEQLKRGTLQ